MANAADIDKCAAGFMRDLKATRLTSGPVYDMATQHARALGLEPPIVLQSASFVENAFCLPLTPPIVVVTDATVKSLGATRGGKLEAVIVHELSHAKGGLGHALTGAFLPYAAPLIAMLAWDMGRYIYNKYREPDPAQMQTYSQEYFAQEPFGIKQEEWNKDGTLWKASKEIVEHVGVGTLGFFGGIEVSKYMHISAEFCADALAAERVSPRAMLEGLQIVQRSASAKQAAETLTFRQFMRDPVVQMGNSRAEPLAQYVNTKTRIHPPTSERIARLEAMEREAGAASKPATAILGRTVEMLEELFVSAVKSLPKLRV